MPAAKKYRRRVSFTLNTEADILNDFAESCRKKGQSISERFTEFMTEELQKNAIGSDSNPINVDYYITTSGKNTLDSYIDKGFVTINHFQQDFKQVKENQKLELYAALGKTITRAAEQIIYFNKNGRYQIQ